MAPHEECAACVGPWTSFVHGQPRPVSSSRSDSATDDRSPWCELSSCSIGRSPAASWQGRSRTASSSGSFLSCSCSSPVSACTRTSATRHRGRSPASSAWPASSSSRSQRRRRAAPAGTRSWSGCRSSSTSPGACFGPWSRSTGSPGGWSRGEGTSRRRTSWSSWPRSWRPSPWPPSSRVPSRRARGSGSRPRRWPCSCAPPSGSVSRSACRGATAAVATLLPGAVVVGVGFLAVNVFTQLAVVWIGDTREDTYGALGLAATILFSLWLTSRVIVVSVVVNAALWSRGRAEQRSRSLTGDDGGPAAAAVGLLRDALAPTEPLPVASAWSLAGSALGVEVRTVGRRRRRLVGLRSLRCSRLR